MLEIRLPRVLGYRVELPEDRLTEEFNEESTLTLTSDLVGPSITREPEQVKAFRDRWCDGIHPICREKFSLDQLPEFPCLRGTQ